MCIYIYMKARICLNVVVAVFKQKYLLRGFAPYTISIPRKLVAPTNAFNDIVLNLDETQRVSDNAGLNRASASPGDIAVSGNTL